MADVVDDSTLDQQHSSSSSSSSRFLEILCTSSGKIRRFSPETDAEFALQLINKKLQNSGEANLALYIEAVKEGEEPISFGLKTQLIDYGDGWELRTVTTTDHPPRQDEASQQDKNAPTVDPSIDPLPDFMELARDAAQSARNNELHFINPYVQEVNELARDDVQSARNHGHHLNNPRVQEVNKPITSEPVSDIESQTIAKWDFTDTFKTDKVFSSRDELTNWIKTIAVSVDNVVVITNSSPRYIIIGCERSGKWVERVKRSERKTSTSKSFPKSKKCECPFQVRGIKIKKEDRWRVILTCGHHNHPIEKPQPGSFCGKLTAEEKEVVMKMSRAGYKGREILEALKSRDPLTEATTVKKIYNTKARIHQKEKQGL